MVRSVDKADAMLTLSSALYYREPFTIFTYIYLMTYFAGQGMIEDHYASIEAEQAREEMLSKIYGGASARDVGDGGSRAARSRHLSSVGTGPLKSAIFGGWYDQVRPLLRRRAGQKIHLPEPVNTEVNPRYRNGYGPRGRFPCGRFPGRRTLTLGPTLTLTLSLSTESRTHRRYGRQFVPADSEGQEPYSARSAP